MSKQKNKMDLDYEEEYNMMSYLPVYTKTIPIHVHKIMLDEPIQKPSYYRNIITVLDSASENDIVEFHLLTPGGNLDTALLIRDAIRTTSARTIAIVHGSVASAGTIPMLSCDDVAIMPLSAVMVHPASWGSWGSTKNMSDYSNFATEYLNKVYLDIYEGFMTVDEISDMVNSSRDIWMSEEEVIRRLEQRENYWINKNAKEVKKAEENTKKKNTRKK